MFKRESISNPKNTILKQEKERHIFEKKLQQKVRAKAQTTNTRWLSP